MIYSLDEKEELIRLYKEGKTKREISKIIGRTYSSVKQYLNTLRKDGTLTETRPVNFKPAAPIDLSPTDLELFTEPQLKREREFLYSKFNDKRAKRILDISDLHIPFHDSRSIKEALKTSADICVVSGDMLDMYSVSTFKKSKLIPLQRELVEGAEIIRILSEMYPHVIISLANHEKRLLRLLQNKFQDQPEIVGIFKDACNVISHLAINYKNVEVINNWWFKLGQAIFCHPDYYSKTRTKTVQNSYEFFMSINEGFEAILNSHTHHFSKIVYFGKVLIENPCLCCMQDYLLDGHRYNAEWVQGYTIVELDQDGHIDKNKTMPYIIG